MFPQQTTAVVLPRSVWCVYNHSIKWDTLEISAGASTGPYCSQGWYMIISGKLSGSAGWCDNFTLRSQNLHQRRDVWAAGTALLVITFKKVTGGWATAFLVQNRHHTDNCLATFKEKVIIKNYKKAQEVLSQNYIFAWRFSGETLQWGGKIHLYVTKLFLSKSSL